MTNIYLEGSVIEITATFRNSSGEIADPTEVTFKHKVGSGSTVTMVYGVDPEIVRISTGVYFVELDNTDKPGTWKYRWTATGNIVTAGEGQYTVRRKNV